MKEFASIGKYVIDVDAILYIEKIESVELRRHFRRIYLRGQIIPLLVTEEEYQKAFKETEDANGSCG